MPEFGNTAEPEEAQALSQLDALAAEIMAGIKPLCFRVAQSSREKEMVYRLRFEVVVEKGWSRPEVFAEGLEQDKHDDEAVHIVGWKNGALIATSRLILPTDERLLPAEEAFDLAIEACDRRVHVDRICIAAEYRRSQPIFWGLLSQTWVEMRARGFSEAVGILSPAMVRIYRSLGINVVLLSDARFHWGEKRYAALLQPARFVQRAKLQAVKALKNSH